MDSLISVTSSGRSSINRIIRCISGLFLVTAVAICFNRVVLPDFGCDTIMPRCPLPIGEIRSTMRIATVFVFFSKWILSFGKIGVSFSNAGLLVASIGSNPLTDSRYKSVENFSFCVRIRFGPLIISPVFKLKRRICVGDTYTSFSPGRKFSQRINPYPSARTSRIPFASGSSDFISLL